MKWKINEIFVRFNINTSFHSIKYLQTFISGPMSIINSISFRMGTSVPEMVLRIGLAILWTDVNQSSTVNTSWAWSFFSPCFFHRFLTLCSIDTRFGLRKKNNKQMRSAFWHCTINIVKNVNSFLCHVWAS